MLIQHSLLGDRPTVQHRRVREWKQRWLLAIASSSVTARRRTPAALDLELSVTSLGA
jgi:hypothetical protein